MFGLAYFIFQFAIVALALSALAFALCFEDAKDYTLDTSLNFTISGVMHFVIFLGTFFVISFTSYRIAYVLMAVVLAGMLPINYHYLYSKRHTKPHQTSAKLQTAYVMSSIVTVTFAVCILAMNW